MAYAPDGRQAKVAFLSGRFGFRDAATPIEDYDTKLTAELAQRMIAGGMTNALASPAIAAVPGQLRRASGCRDRLARAPRRRTLR